MVDFLSSMFDPKNFAGVTGLLDRMGPAMAFQPSQQPAAFGLGGPAPVQPPTIQPAPANDVLPENATPTAGIAPVGLVPAQAPATPAPSSGGAMDFLGGVRDKINDNSNMLLGLAAGIAGGKNMGEGISKGLTLAMTGGQLDTQQGNRNRTQQFLLSKGMDPATARAVSSDPTLLRTMLPQLMGVGGSADIQAYNLYRQQGGDLPFLDFKTKLAEAGATRINNSIQSGEKAYETTVGKDYGTLFTDLQKGGRDATKAIGTLNLMENLTKDPNFYSGFGGDVALRANQALVGLGVKDQKAASAAETFRALGNQTVLDAAGGSLGNQISNGDREYINATTANLANTPEGNRELIGIRRKLATRQQETARLARDYATSHGGRIDAGFDDFLSDWVEKHPLFPQAPKQEQPSSVDSSPADGVTATNPQTGQRLIRRNGKWEPLT